MSALTPHLVTRDLDAAAAWSLHDAFWGDRTGRFIDPFGRRWAVDQRVRDVPRDEITRLAAAAFGEGAG